MLATDQYVDTLEEVDYTNVGPLIAQLATFDEGTERDQFRRRIITTCLPLAEHIARRYRDRGEPADDLYQVACVGLVKAVDRYDAARGGSFLSFAVPTMMGEVRRHFRDHSWSMHVTRGMKEDFLRVKAALDVLSHRFGRPPTVSEIATELHLAPEAASQALIVGSACRLDSLDAVTTVDGSGDQVAQECPGCDDPRYEEVEQYLSVKPLIAALPARERAVLRMRFFDCLTQSQIAARIGVSQMQVSRILAKVLQQLRDQAGAEADDQAPCPASNSRTSENVISSPSRSGACPPSGATSRPA